MAAKAKPKVFSYVEVHTSPALAAADVATALLKLTACSSLSEMYAKMHDGNEAVVSKLKTIALSDEQLAGLEEYEATIALLRIGPTVNVTECDQCRAIQAVEGPPPRTCGSTLGCGGVPVKSTVARKSELVDAD